MDPAAVTAAITGDDVTISARVVDYLPVRGATLHYKAGSGDWQDLTMTQDGDVYQATIPGPDVTTDGLVDYIEAGDGATTATYPPSDPVNAPQVITVSARPAPAAVSDLNGSCSGNDAVLSWSAVTQDVDGNTVTVDHYAVYRRANEPYFTPTPGDIIADNVTGTTCTDLNILTGGPGSYFYAVTAVDSHGGASAVSSRVGVFTFGLQPGDVAVQAQGEERSMMWLPVIQR